MTNIRSGGDAHCLLGALAEQLAAAGERYELVVVGGAGLRARR